MGLCNWTRCISCIIWFTNILNRRSLESEPGYLAIIIIYYLYWYIPELASFCVNSILLKYLFNYTNLSPIFLFFILCPRAIWILTEFIIKHKWTIVFAYIYVVYMNSYIFCTNIVLDACFNGCSKVNTSKRRLFRLSYCFCLCRKIKCYLGYLTCYFR